MKLIEVSDANYEALITRQSLYKVESLDAVITVLLRDTDVQATKTSMTIVHTQEKKAAIKKSTDVKTGYLWQTFAKTLPNFPYDFRELFDVHGAFPSPIDAIAFPGLANDQITSVHVIDYQLGQYATNKHKAQVKKCISTGCLEFRLVRPQDVGIHIEPVEPLEE